MIQDGRFADFVVLAPSCVDGEPVSVCFKRSSGSFQIACIMTTRRRGGRRARRRRVRGRRDCRGCRGCR
eukprot:6845465-Pyramimonas_sp.AAC.1